MERKISANRVYITGDQVIKDGVVTYDPKTGVILNVEEGKDKEPANTRFYNGVITAGFVNAHCHLEYSHLKGVKPKAPGLSGFIRHILDAREAERALVQQAMGEADKAMRLEGIVAVADTSNSDVSFGPKIDSGIDYHTFYELTGYEAEPKKMSEAKVATTFLILNKMSTNITPHSCYANSPAFIKQLAGLIGDGNGMLSLHFMESPEEKELFEDKRGGLAKLLETLGMDLKGWNPKKLSQAQYLKELLPEDLKTILVHNTVATEEDMKTLSGHKHLWWALCPRSNLFVENKLPDIEMLSRHTAQILIGTDSLASNESLSILEEMKTITAHCPGISFGQMLNWASINGACALNRQKKIGSIEQGKTPGLNLIENFDFKADGLNEDSRVTVLA